jgi:AI-2 transport protein TqsA
MEKRPTLVAPFRELRLEEVVVRKHIHTACLFVLALVAGGSVLVHLRAVLVPFVLAMGLFYSLLPIVDLLSAQPSSRRSGGSRGCLNAQTQIKKKDRVCGYDEDDYKGRADVPDYMKAIIAATVWMRRCRLPRPVAVVVALLLACIFIAVLVVVVMSSVNELAGHADKYTSRVNSMVDWVVSWGHWLGVDISNQSLTEKLTHHTAFLSEIVVRSLSIVAEELSNGFLMLLFTAYLLLGYATSSPDTYRVSGVRAEIDTQVKRYIGFKMLLSASVGLIVGLSLLVLKVDLALVFGLLAFLLNFIPNVGGVISTLLPMPVVIFDPGKTWFDMLLAFCIPATLHAIVGNVIEPRVLGGAMELHPIVVLLSLMLWGSLWGVVGMILSVPITACIKICLQSLDHPIPRFLAGTFEGIVDIPQHDPDNDSPLLHPAGLGKGTSLRGCMSMREGGGKDFEMAVLEAAESPRAAGERDVEAGVSESLLTNLLPIKLEAPRSGGSGMRS